MVPHGCRVGGPPHAIAVPQLIDNKLGPGKEQAASTRGTAYFAVALAAPVPDLKAVVLYTPAIGSGARGFENLTVSLSTSATLGAGTISVCASGLTEPAEGAVVRVACEGAAFGGSWQYVYVTKPPSNVGAVAFQLAEIQVMRGGA